MGAGVCGAIGIELSPSVNREEIVKFLPTFRALKIEEADVHKLHQAFVKVDADASLSISLAEFFDFFGLTYSQFGKRCFAIFDEDDSGELDFREFVVSLWNYCTFDAIALTSFAFDLYDLDGSGSIDGSELRRILQEVYGSDGAQTNVYAQNVYKKIKRYVGSDTGDEGQISKPDFVTFSKKHPALLFPAFLMQQTLQKCILGASFWKRLAKKRAKAFGREGIDINWLRKLVTHNGFIRLAEEAGKDIEKEDRAVRNRKNVKKRQLSSSQPASGGRFVSPVTARRKSKAMKARSKSVCKSMQQHIKPSHALRNNKSTTIQVKIRRRKTVSPPSGPPSLAIPPSPTYIGSSRRRSIKTLHSFSG